MNTYRIARSYQSSIDFCGENYQSYKNAPDPKSVLPIGNLNFCSISKNRIAVFGEFKGENHKMALKEFSKEVDQWLPKIIFIAQTSVEKQYGTVCYKEGAGHAILWRALYRNVGNSFNHLTTLPILKELSEQRVSEEFYLYWADASMTHNYIGKLSLMFFALEALAKSKGDKDEILKEILGKDLKDKAWKMRNQLAHGDQREGEVLYTDIHKKTVEYFNKNILEKNCLSEDFMLPQRNSGSFINSVSTVYSQTESFDLIKILKYLNMYDVNPLVQGSSYNIGPDSEVVACVKAY